MPRANVALGMRILLVNLVRAAEPHNPRPENTTTNRRRRSVIRRRHRHESGKSCWPLILGDVVSCAVIQLAIAGVGMRCANQNRDDRMSERPRGSRASIEITHGI